MRGHYIICGYGRIGRAIASELEEKNIPFVVIEEDKNMVQTAEHKGLISLQGNATTDLVLLSAGIKRARGIVAALNSDSDNLYIALASRELNAEL